MSGVRSRWVSIPRWGRAALIFCAALLVLWLLRVPLLVSVARVLDVGEEPVRADLIYVLGGGVEERAPKAAELYRAGYAKRILIPQVIDSKASLLGLTPNETEVALGLLMADGVPRSAITIVEGQSGKASSTTQEGEILREFLQKNSAARMIVVTTSHHTRRARWAMRRALNGVPVEVVMVGAADSEFDETNWWRREAGVIRVVEEYLKFAHNWLYR